MFSGGFMEYKHEYLPLSIDKGKLYLINDKLKKRVEELELFLQDNKYMNSKEFSKNVLFSQEIKNNNTIEGYNDDVGLVYDILNNKLNINFLVLVKAVIIHVYNSFFHLLIFKVKVL